VVLVQVENKTRYFSYDDMLEFVNNEKLAHFINDVKRDRTCILTMSRGGLVPSQFISQKFDIKDVFVVNINSYTDENKRGFLDLTKFQLPPQLKEYDSIIIVDDINDSGNTLQYVIDRVFEYTNHIISVWSITLFEKKASTIYTIYCPNRDIDKDTWIKFFWEI
jgi:hypoxanthine phosphoribosyltransferase